MVSPSKERTMATKWCSIGEPRACDKLPQAQLSVLTICPRGGVVLLFTRVPTCSPLLLLLFGAPDLASFKTSEIMPTYLTP